MLIEGEDLTVTIDNRTIISGESVRCEPGKMTALVGPSGSGKTTLLHSLGLLLPITHGRITIAGRDATGWNSRKCRKFWRDHAAFVLQDYGIIDDESAAFNVALRSRKTDDAQVADALKRTGLAHRGPELASHFSGGEKQRLALARAIYRKAAVLLVDEPTASLDQNNRHAVINLFTDFARSGATVIISTHDEEMIAACDTQHTMTTRHSENLATLD
ncbi:MAG: ATP-binding cassette domain-containing protein [Kocuria sp.]|nr:ATP-binding cassette domain-containing protein [Kocuria sp.]